MTLYPIWYTGDGQAISLCWDMTLEQARHLARQLTEACDAVENAPPFREEASS